MNLFHLQNIDLRCNYIRFVKYETKLGLLIKVRFLQNSWHFSLQIYFSEKILIEIVMQIERVARHQKNSRY
jgi:hypothetical protein